MYGLLHNHSLKAIPVIGCEGPQGWDMLRFLHCLDNRLTDGSEVVSIMQQMRFTPQKNFYF
jgi:hypothetical protein